MHLFPAIDLLGGRVVRLYKGDYGRQTTYEADPLQQAQAFADAGASWLHVVDLEGARSGKPAHLEIIETICRHTPLKVEVGGGVRHEQTIRQLIAAGARRVILGTAALKNWEWFEHVAADPRLANKLVLGLDARDGRVAIDGWQETTGTSAVELAERVSDWPLSAIVYTDIATDGTLEGPNLDATEQMTAATRVPIVASGGVGTLDHLRALRRLKLQGIIVGRALYDGAFTIDQAIDAVER